MGRYDRHARELMRSMFGQDWVEGDESVYSFGEGGGYGEVDGTIAGQIAVEFGVGSPKQIRAAILHLVLHP
jgi:hypothetical protein